jgi:hypothetical protein
MMQKTYLLVQDSDSLIMGCMTQDDPDAGPIYPQHGAPDGVTLVDMPAGGFTRAGRRETEVAHLIDGVVEWTDIAQLADTIAQAIAAIDSAADAARMEVIARQTNMPEYVRAEVQARAFKAAGYPADVPRSVAGWARAKWRDGLTAQQAADDIIATADRWYALLDDIRDLRLYAKEDVRHAANNDDALARVQQFTTDLTNLMKGAA